MIVTLDLSSVLFLYATSTYTSLIDLYALFFVQVCDLLIWSDKKLRIKLNHFKLDVNHMTLVVDFGGLLSHNDLIVVFRILGYEICLKH